MATDLQDCDWCGSARSIEFGLCQVCLMEYPAETKVIELPRERRISLNEGVIVLPESEVAAE